MKVGLVGWRGMVGFVLMQRMVEENDFAHFEPFYFSTSNAGGEAPAFGGKVSKSCQGRVNRLLAIKLSLNRRSDSINVVKLNSAGSDAI